MCQSLVIFSAKCHLFSHRTGTERISAERESVFCSQRQISDRTKSGRILHGRKCDFCSFQAWSGQLRCKWDCRSYDCRRKHCNSIHGLFTKARFPQLMLQVVFFLQGIFYKEFTMNCLDLSASNWLLSDESLWGIIIVSKLHFVWHRLWSHTIINHRAHFIVWKRRYFLAL